MRHEHTKYIHDIFDAIEMIRHHLADVKSFTEYTKNYTVIDAVERRLGIIGEAFWQASKLNTNIAVTDQKKIIGFRHILVHDYDLIDDATIWKIVHEKLDLLKEELQKYI